MPTEDFSISFEDLVDASPTPDTQDQSISFDDVESFKAGSKTKESEPIPFGSVVDEFSLDDPETLYNAIKRNPEQNYTDEQIDAYLTFASKKEFKPGKVLSSFTQGIGPAVLELGKGAYDILKQGYNLAAANRYSEKSKIMKEMGLTALEGAARGAYDLGMIGKIIGLNNSLNKTDYSQASPTSYSMGGHSQGSKQISYADFNEEDKSKVRRKFRDLNKILADRQAYTEGEQTIIGDIGIATSRSPESIENAIEQADVIAGMIPPRAAETYSMLLGIEGAVPYVVGKLGVKPLQMGVAKGLLAGSEEVTSLVSDATQAIQKGVDNLRKPLPEGVTAGARLTDAPGAVSQVSQGLSSTFGAARRQLDNTSEPNIFMAMSRDVEFIRKNPTLAETARFLGHGVYNDFGVLSDLANRSRPLGRLMLSGTVGGTRSAIGGSIIALPTFDEEMIGQQMAASFATGFGFGGAGGALLHSKKRIDSLADDFMNAIGEENQTIIRTRMESSDEEVKLGKGDLARAQTALNFVRRVTNATAGDTDIDVVFWDGNNIEAVQKYLSENGVDQALKLDEVSENYGNQFENADADKQFSHVRGFQILNTRRAGAKPVLVYNLKTMTGSTMMHEIVHGMKRLDLYKGHFSEIESVAFDSSARDGDEPTKGLISDDELFEFYEQMLQRADPETAERIRQDDKELATKATPGTPQENAGYWVKTRMKEEVLADMFESFLYNKEPLYITRAGLPENSGRMRKMFAPVARMMSLFIQKTTPEGFLSRQGYRRKGSQDPLAYDSPALEHAMNGLINYQNRLLVDEGKLVRGQVSEEPLGEVFKRTQIKKGTALAKSMESSLLVKHDTDGKAMYDSEGNIMLEDSQKIIRKKEKERANFFTDTFTSQYYVDDPNTKGKSALRYRPDDDAISGDYISDDAMEKLRNAPPSVMPKALLENLEILNDAAKTGRPVEMDYNARLYVNKKGRKTQRAQYSSKLGSSIRLVVPYSFYVSKTGGNLLVNNLELSHLNSKYNRIMGDPVRSKNITSLWGNSRKDFDRDLVKYFGNILDPGDPGPTGVGLGKDLDPDASIARKKANVLSAFLGFTKKDIDFKGNPVDQQNLLDQMNPERQDNLVHSRRLDAVNSVRLTDLERMPLSVSGRRMIQKNYDPGRLQQAYDEALEQDRNDPNLGEKGEQKARGIVRRLAESMGYTIPAFHGTQRIDRIGNKFLSSRATSGPMAFFTSSPEIARNYSTSKSDTSIKEIPDWVDQFLVKSKGKMVPVTRMFNPYDRKLADNLSKVSMDDDGNIVMGDGVGGDWGYYMRDNGNNALKAAADLWLNSGYIYGEEAKFADVLKTAGFKGEVIWDDPYAQKSGVVEAYLRLTNPIDVTKMSQADYDYLIRSVKGKRAKPRKGGADQWDKNDVSGEQFAERLKNDREDGTTWAWTAIPDFVTQALKERGYDGIIDTGGKGGGQQHEVYIPFYPSQIKSAQTVTRDKRGNIIPLLERFDQSTSDIRFDPGDTSSSRMASFDNDYLEAVNNSDISRAHHLLKQRASQSGYPLVAFHGAPDINPILKDKRFKTWSEIYNGERKNEEAYFFTSDYKTAKTYADDKRAWDYQSSVSGVKQFYLDLGKTKVIDGKGEKWTLKTQQSVEEAKRQGYDSYTVKNIKDTYMPGDRLSTVYAVFRPEQIKSADPVTRTDDGEVIPLSERFNKSTSDIRFDPGNNSSNQKGFWYNETDDQPAKQPSKETTQAFRWKQVAEELERRKSDEADAGSVEELVFGGRQFDRSWFSPVGNMGEAAARMDAQDGHLLDWSQQNGYYIPKEDFEYAISTSSKGTLAGKEHRVFLTPDGKSVIKVTHNDQYGKPFKTASEYLQQMDDYNSVVSPDMQRTFIGITEVRPGVPAIVTGQSFVTGSKIVDEQIGGYMEKEGFEQLGSLYVYQHPSGIRIYDLHHENAVIGDDGKIKPYDIWVDIPRGDEIQKRFKPTRTMDEGKIKVYQNQEGYQAIEQEDGSVKIYEPTGEELSELFSNIIEAESHLLQVA